MERRGNVERVHAFVVVGLVVAAAMAVIGALRGHGLRRRLVLALVGAALVPAVVVSVVMVGTMRTVLSVLEAPGLREAADGGLGLARAWIDRETELARAALDSVSVAIDRGEDPGASVTGLDGWRLRGGGTAAGSGRDPSHWIGTSTVPGTVVRLDADPPAVVVVRAVVDRDATLVGVRVLPIAVADDVRRVEAGSRGIRQLGLVLRPVLANGLLAIGVVTLLAVALLAVGVGREVGGRLVRPLADLVEGTRRVASGDLEHRVGTRAVGEVGELVDAFNGMTARLAEGERRLRRSERLAAWQGIARRLAHEIKNPLTPIQLAVHRLGRRVDDPASRESLRAIEEEVANLRRLADEFSALGRLPEPRLSDVDLGDTARSVVDLYVPDTVGLELDLERAARVRADEGQLRQVLSNLVKNAVQAIDGRGILHVVVRSGSPFVELRVEDDGPGLGSDGDRVFEAGFTTRSTGTGLGLAIAQRIVEDHGGTIEAGESRLGGASFRVWWPAVDRSSEGSEENA